MDIIQGLIETGNAGKSGWKIVNNKGAFGVVNKRTSNVSYSILNSGTIGTGATFVNTYNSTSSPTPSITATPSATTTGTTGNYTYHVFTYTTDTAGAGTGQSLYTINVPSGGVVCDVLVVGGGGNGGNGENANRGAGGGGAGGLIYIQGVSLIGTYTITVGKNEKNSSITTTATNQININGNLVTTLIATAGGRGGTTSASGAVNGIGGGSGGGGADWNGVGANSTQNTYFGTGFGFKGGNSSGMTYDVGGAGAGGGGAGGIGSNQEGYTRGLGGPGKIIDITGTQIEYAVGGNGSTIWSNNGVNGINNRGNGGAGAGRDNLTGGTGGTGIVIIRYLAVSTSSSIALIQEPNLNVITNYVGGVTSSSSGGGSSQWTTITGSKIYYNGGNVGIGTIDPIAPLHIYNNTTTATLPTEIVVAGATSATISGTTDRVISFPYSGSGTTKDYTFTTTEALICDILIVGGGGGGGQFGGGGGGGSILFGSNISISTSNSISIKVGNGGTGSTSFNAGINGINGNDTSIIINTIEYIAKGGGGGGSRNGTNVGRDGNAGGSGGGGSHGNSGTQSQGGLSNKLTYPNFQSFGNIGGLGKFGIIPPEPTHASGGGGGAGSVGGNGTGSGSGTGGGNGGTGKEFISYFGSGVGHAGWFGGGGGGNTFTSAGNRGYGNGGNGLLGGGGSGGFDGDTEFSGDNGLANTGGGGGGSKWDGSGSNNGGNGGSGIVIIRYRKQTQPSVSNARLLLDATTTGTTAIEFRRGVGSDAQNDFRIINDTNSSLKLQCENSAQFFGNTVADLAWFSSNETIIHKNTTMNGRVGIGGTTYHATRSLDVVGDANVFGAMSTGSLSVNGNATITNSSSSNVSLTIQNGFVTLPNEIVVSPLPTEIVVTGTTFGTIGTTDRYISFPYSGSATTKDYTFTTTENLICDILIVGGGGAGSGTIGGGGGAGALIFARNATLSNGTYTISVGSGGTGGSTGQGTKGNNSSISKDGINITAEGGGASGRGDGNQNGGSGGGGDYWEGNQTGGTSTSYTSTAFGASIVKYGNNGANAYTPSPFNGGGGGGAGSSALIATSTNLFSNGGIGLHQVIIDGTTINFATIFGTNTAQVGGVLSNGNLYYGGGGGGGGNETSLGGTGGIGGGGNGGAGSSGSVPPYIPIHGSDGFPNTGGGGGGGSNHPSLGGNGGSGIIIIRYRKPPAETVVSAIIPGTTDRYISFPYSGTAATKDYTITTTENLVCDILVVGGGGGGGSGHGGGGGAGTLIYKTNYTFSSGSYTIAIGSGGKGGPGSPNENNGVNGQDTTIVFNTTTIFRAKGGGKGHRVGTGGSGGSGGGAGGDGGGNSSVLTNNIPQDSDVFGFAGGSAVSLNYIHTGGGGGAGSVGGNGSGNTSGNGGVGKSISITGTSVFYAGGGGGSISGSNGTVGLGGAGGGANGSINGVDGFSAQPNTGGGGGGSGYGSMIGKAGDGGSGIIIIRYRRQSFNQSAALELTSSSTAPIIEPIAKGIKQYPETPSTNADSWTDNGFTVTCKTSDAILSPQNTFYLFNNLIASPDHYHGAQLFNGSSPFNYTSSTSFKGANGLVLYIDLGRSITLRNMRMAPRDNASHPTLNFLGAAPGIFKIYASNDSACWTSTTHASWTEIHSQTTSLTFNYNQFTYFGNFSSIATPYRYFAMVVYNLSGNYSYLTFSEWDIFGTYDMTPVVINSDYKYLSFTYDSTVVEQKTGVGGWRLVRFLPPTATAWYQGDNNLAGTTTYGTAYNYTNAWSIPFGTFDEFVFGTLNLQYWMQITKTEAIGTNYSGVSRNIIKSSYSSTPYSAIQYNRAGNNEDPWMSIRDHPTDLVYGENSWTLPLTPLVSVDGGMGVWVRNSAEAQATLPSQTSYTVNFPESTLCDILVVGGGGGGDTDNASGGGGGAVLYATNITIPANTYTIKVGKGGLPNVNGSSSEAFGAICLGGGSTPYVVWPTANNGTSGGSGSGGSSGYALGTGGGVGVSTKGTLLNLGTIYNGNIGGNGLGQFGGGTFPVCSGGGGGAGTAGISSTQVDYTTRSSWIAAGKPASGGDGVAINITGTSYYWGAGGGGGSYNTHSGDGGLGGGGGGGAINRPAGLAGTGGINNGTNGSVSGGDGATNTGSGGGGGGGGGTGGRGGSGIVIIRYKSTKSGNQTYKVGNYSGEFKVISSVSNTDTDYIKITSAGAITNPMGTASWNTGSDRRIKENIERASYDKCLDNINKLELNRFNYIDGFNTVNRDRTQLGFIAQEVKDIFPKSISSQEYYSNTLNIPDLLSIDITQINYSLYGAVKKLIEINIEKDIRIITLNNRIKILKNLLNITDDAYTSNLVLGDESSITITDNNTSNIVADTIVIDANTSNIASNE